jgi:hypothetical protein
MSWYNGGNWHGFPRDDFSEVLAELMYAVNEREVSSNGAATTWKMTANGPFIDPFPSRSALSGYVMSSLYIKNLLTQLQQAVFLLAYNGSSFHYHFVKSVDGEDYTPAQLLQDAGFGNAWIAPAVFTDSACINQLKACLELLVYYKGNVSVYAESPNGIYYGSTQQASWAACVPFTKGWRIGCDQTAHINTFATHIFKRGDQRLTWGTGTGGSPIKFFITLNESCFGEPPAPFQYTFDYGVGSTTLVTNVVTGELVRRQEIPALLTETSPKTTSLSWSPPTQHPFPDLSPGAFSKLWVDLIGGDVVVQLIPGIDLTYG